MAYQRQSGCCAASAVSAAIVGCATIVIPIY
jgi:hypothetical protein